MESQPHLRQNGSVAWAPAVTSHVQRLLASCPTFSTVLRRPRALKPSLERGETSVCVLVGREPRKRKAHDCNKLAFQEALTKGPEGHPVAVIGVVFLSVVSGVLHMTCHHPSCGITFGLRLRALQLAVRQCREGLLSNPDFAKAKEIHLEIATLEDAQAFLEVFDKLGLQWQGAVRSDALLVRAAIHSLTDVIDKFVQLRIDDSAPQQQTTMPVTTEVLHHGIHELSLFKCDGPLALGGQSPALAHEALRESLRGVIGVATAGRSQEAASPMVQLEPTSSPIARQHHDAACAANHRANVWSHAPYSPLSPRHNNVAGLVPALPPHNLRKPLQALTLDALHANRPSIVVAVERRVGWRHTPYLPLHAAGPLLDEVTPWASLP